MEIFYQAVVGSIKQLFVNAIPQKYFLVLIWAMAFDVLTGVIQAAKERKFNSSVGSTGILRKIAMLAGCTFVGVLEYLLWQENVLAKTVILLALAYEATSVFENLNAIDPRFGETTKTIVDTIVGRIRGHASKKDHDAR